MTHYTFIDERRDNTSVKVCMKQPHPHGIFPYQNVEIEFTSKSVDEQLDIQRRDSPVMMVITNGNHGYTAYYTQ